MIERHEFDTSLFALVAAEDAAEKLVAVSSDEPILRAIYNNLGAVETLVAFGGKTIPDAPFSDAIQSPLIFPCFASPYNLMIARF